MNSTYWKNEVLSSVYLTGGRQFYIGLSSTVPQPDGSGVNEPDGGSYERVALTSLYLAADGLISNEETISFPTSTAAWFNGEEILMCYVIFDGKTKDARVLSYETLMPQRNIGIDVTIKLPADTLQVELLDG